MWWPSSLVEGSQTESAESSYQQYLESRVAAGMPSRVQTGQQNDSLEGKNGKVVPETLMFVLSSFQVFHPLCSTLKIFDITATSVTNAGLIIILQKLTKLNSLGEYSISDNFLKSLFVVPYLNIDKFGLLSVHTRKVELQNYFHWQYI